MMMMMPSNAETIPPVFRLSADAERLGELLLDGDVETIHAMGRKPEEEVLYPQYHQLVRVPRYDRLWPDEGEMYQTALLELYDFGGTQPKSPAQVSGSLAYRFGHHQTYRLTEALLQSCVYQASSSDDESGLICWRVLVRASDKQPIRVSPVGDLMHYVAVVCSQSTLDFEPLCALFAAHGIRPGSMALAFLTSCLMHGRSWQYKLQPYERKLMVRMSTVVARHMAIVQLCGLSEDTIVNRLRLDAARVRKTLGKDVMRLRTSDGATLMHAMVRFYHHAQEEEIPAVWTTLIQLEEVPLFARDRHGRLAVELVTVGDERLRQALWAGMRAEARRDWPSVAMLVRGRMRASSPLLTPPFDLFRRTVQMAIESAFFTA